MVFSGDRIDLGVFKINSKCVLIVRPFNKIENIERSMNLALSAKDGFQKVSSFRSTDNEHMIFDSASPGTEIRRDFIEFSLSVGRHDISTYEDRSCGREMVFHRFDLIADN